MSLEQVEQCPVCHGKSFQPFLVCKDYTATGQLFHVEQCASCKMLITNPRPAQNDAAGYYQSPTYISHTSAASGLLDYIYLIIRQFALKWKYTLVKPHLHDKLLLDLGSGTGSFISYCKQAGVNAYGVEPSAHARASTGDPHIVDSLEKLPDIKFNVITLWHVLEHIYDLEATLENLKNKLSDNGIIFIAVPNWQSPDSTYYREQWAAYDVPRHVWHFSKANMKTLLQNAGLTLKEIIPMKLDAYYVSLLSEKNTTKGFSIPGTMKALATAYRSNREAKASTNHSSLIYVAQK